MPSSPPHSTDRHDRLRADPLTYVTADTPRRLSAHKDISRPPTGKSRCPLTHMYRLDTRPAGTAAAKVLIFIDGQNPYETCRSPLGHRLCHTHPLAQHLAGRRTHVECRFHTGPPTRTPTPEAHGTRSGLGEVIAVAWAAEGLTQILGPLTALLVPAPRFVFVLGAEAP